MQFLLLASGILFWAGSTSSQSTTAVVYRDANAVIYMNPRIDKDRTKWIYSLYSRSWAHVRRHYGNFQNNEGGRLKGVFQATAGEGGMATGVNSGNAEIYMDISPGGVQAGNLYDKPGSNNRRPNQDLLFDFQVGAISRIIEEGNNGMRGSPAAGVWGSKGWTQIAIFDIFMNTGYRAEAEQWRRSKLNEPVDAATAKNQVYWLRDWWSPIYDKYGRTALLGRFFKLVAENWPKESGNQYKGTMNVGQFVHFFSGAARTCLKEQAEFALGWEQEDEDSFQKAKEDFPNITY